jgi:2-polyprenyl-3-methyl-5-hydroxy-6-metoxy-1,4-benzoquinol methylase
LLLAPADFALGRLPTLLRSFFAAWLLGGLLLGLALAAPAVVLTAAVVRWRRVSPDEQVWRAHRAAVQRAFARAPRGHRGYVAGKLRMDPVYQRICEGLGQVERALDLGTGLGLLPLLLAVRGQARELVGLDWDAAKLESARLAAASLSADTAARLRFDAADVTAAALPQADAVFLIDVLHYYPPSEQAQLLDRAAAALRPGGQLIVRETDRNGRSLLTRRVEAAAMRLRWNKGPGLSYRSAAELGAELERLGLRCREQAASSAVHRGNVLLWAQRAVETESAFPTR